MNKLLISLLMTLSSSFALAYHIDAYQEGLADTDTFSIFIKRVMGDCEIVNGEYNCMESTTTLNGIPFSRMKEYFDLANRAGQDQKLVELNIKINKQTFASCQNLQERGQDFTLIFTPEGCL